MSSKLVPVSRLELVRRLGELGFGGPYIGSGHEYMTKGAIRIKLPNPHHGHDIGADLLARILRDTGISRRVASYTYCFIQPSQIGLHPLLPNYPFPSSWQIQVYNQSINRRVT